MPRVTSPDNPRLKQAIRLIASSRERRKEGLCVLEGTHLVNAYMSRYGAPESLIVLEAGNPEARSLCESVPPSRLLTLSVTAWTAFTQLPIEVGVIAVVPTPKFTPGRIANFCVLLEDLQDPGNVGSILRSAAAAGVKQIFMSRGCAFAWSPKVLRAGQGGHFHLDIFEDIDLVAWAKGYRGETVATVATGGEPLFEADLCGAIAIAIGNEGTGLSHQMRAAATRQVTIPMPGNFESLNAAAATAVCLFECVRQRGTRK